MLPTPPVVLSITAIAGLQEKGINTLHPPDAVTFPSGSVFEPPCSLKWMRAEYGFELGAFSYGVSGYFFACRIGRYCSFGEAVQVGRHPHPLDFISSSPVFYQRSADVLGVTRHAALPDEITRPSRRPTIPKVTTIGHDVYIGHGAFILPGVTVGHGAVIGACAVVTKDVPPYAVVAGSPATIRKYRFDQPMIDRILESRWWEFTPRDYSGVDPANPQAFVDCARRLRDAGRTVYAPTPVHLGDLISALSTDSK